MVETSKTWPDLGQQAERNAMLQVLLEELQVYEIMLERLHLECGGRPSKYEDLKSERELQSQIAARESMIRILALKNTEFTV